MALWHLWVTGLVVPSLLVTKHFLSLKVGPAAECLRPPHTCMKILWTCSPLIALLPACVRVTLASRGSVTSLSLHDTSGSLAAQEWGDFPLKGYPTGKHPNLRSLLFLAQVTFIVSHILPDSLELRDSSMCKLLNLFWTYPALG